jgi:hypothetical protein
MSRQLAISEQLGIYRIVISDRSSLTIGYPLELMIKTLQNEKEKIHIVCQNLYKVITTSAVTIERTLRRLSSSSYIFLFTREMTGNSLRSFFFSFFTI